VYGALESLRLIWCLPVKNWVSDVTPPPVTIEPVEAE
jgi:hypothetical protein